MGAPHVVRPECLESYKPRCFAYKKSDLVHLCNILNDTRFGRPCPFRKLDRYDLPEVMKKGEE